jgi:hypothetical protein
MPSRIRRARMYWFQADCAEHAAARARLLSLQPLRTKVQLNTKAGFQSWVSPGHPPLGTRVRLPEDWAKTKRPDSFDCVRSVPTRTQVACDNSERLDVDNHLVATVFRMKVWRVGTLKTRGFH